MRALFTATIFLGSFLLFLIQPMVARLALPTLGGSPNVWNVAMLFYQGALLLGYLYAHLLSRFAVRTQAGLHVALFLLAALTLPVGLATPVGINASTAPGLWLLAALAGGIGLLFVTVAAQAPLMQAWFARSGDRDAANPWFLYAASNAGSLLGLLAYPFLLEPLTALPAQTLGWSIGFGALLLLVGLCGWRVGFMPPPSAARTPPPPAGEMGEQSAAGAGIGWRRRVRWVLLAAVPSGLMLSSTTHITTDIMAMPLLWVLPLGLYLISFILVFGGNGAAWTRRAVLVAPVLLLLFGGVGLFAIGKVATLYGLATLLLLLVIAVALHGTLAGDRPHPSRLTEFYLWMSFGGALGGLFCGLLAPMLFDWTYEYPLLLVLAALLLPARPLTRRIGRLWQGRPRLLTAFAVVALAALGWWTSFAISIDALQMLIVAPVAVIALIAVLAIGRPALFAFALLNLMLALGGWKQIDISTIPGARERSFFGIYSIENNYADNSRRLLHGTTLHGIQSLDPALSRTPLSYYAPKSGVGQVMRAAPALFGPGASIAFVGLGTGSLACYAQPGQRWTVYEIDPVIVRMAFDPKRFSYVSQCKPDLAVKLGDARLELAATPAASLDVLAVDAFSSDAIPLHLMTKEAFAIYKRVLRQDGVLLVHISNRFLRLAPVVAAIAAESGWRARELQYKPTSEDNAGNRTFTSSDWIVLTRSEARMAAVLAATDGDWQPLPRDAAVSAWSDDFASILPTLKPLHIPGL
ncbi:fused MFS/spermidine synthase [Sandaracinobacteroides saxicola]|uniref:Fused MFS/spermidine synthase n=1 Tax=Sandaracinobacteroides saxicola TaxID=2759707 RepID=A0A7G5IKC2_9SPHN|nr:fused MFS/spermidine synthase [Sandaracinobacteroides saxicola]QMW23814.1 fused MFS/spermidine synthase [Sandaracinobacteroides saxicola]